jgi:hypothetical protein
VVRATTRTSFFGGCIALVAGLLAILALAPAASAGGLRDRPVQPKVLKQELATQLKQRGLNTRRILPWRATGNYADGPAYQCGGFASYAVSSHSWRVDRCLNADLWNLLRERGLEPKAILNARRVDGGVKYEWRAEGVWPGDVPYRCKNVALYSRATGKWRIGACDNEIAAVEPLSATLGPQPVFGFNDNWTQSGVLSQLNKAVALGATTARFMIAWSAVEKTRGNYTWGAYDQLVSTMLSQGVHPLLIAYGAPCWAQEHPNDCSPVGPPSASEVDDFAHFAALVAQRYPQALGVEIWNEPNWSVFWAPKPDPARYSAMVRTSAAAIKAQGSKVPVIVAGDAPLANSSPDGTKIAFDEFMRDVYAAGGIGQADAIGHHLYFGAVDDYILNMRQQIARLRGVMASHGDGEMPIWITEIGISSSEETDLQGQGTLLAQLFTTLRRIQNVPVVVVHRLMDARDSLTGGFDDRGLLDSNGNRKPAYCALAQALGVNPQGC